MDPNSSNQESVNGTTQPIPPSGHVRKVKQTWQQFEDFGLAHRLQHEEFSQHFDLNRSERRLMQGDIRLSKEEQNQEDKYAAEYYEQLRRDREREDERLAMEIQRRLETEEGKHMSTKRARELEDEMLARRLQSMEMKKKSAAPPASQQSAQVFAGSSSGHYRPAPQRHASIPTDVRGHRIPSQASGAHQNSHAHQPVAGFSQTGATLASNSSSASNKKSPPPRPPPPRHNSLR